MAKKKKKNQVKDNKLTINQTMKAMNDMCYQLENIVLLTLNKEFGFGDKRKEKFMKAFKQEMNRYLLQEELKLRKQARF